MANPGMNPKRTLAAVVGIGAARIESRAGASANAQASAKATG